MTLAVAGSSPCSRYWRALASVLWGACLPLLPADDRPTLAVPEFQEIGDIARGSGMEIALFVASAVDPSRFQVKERIHLKQWTREQLAGDPSRSEFLRDLKAEQVLLGTVGRTAGEYVVTYYIVDGSGNILGKDSIGSTTWRNLKDDLRRSLIGQRLAPAPPGYEWQRRATTAGAGLLALLAAAALWRIRRRRRRERPYRMFRQIVRALEIARNNLRRLAQKSEDPGKYPAIDRDLETLLIQIQGSSREEMAHAVWHDMSAAARSLHQISLSRQLPPVGELERHVAELQSHFGHGTKNFL